MKIIIPGALPAPRPQWPIGFEFECRCCRCRFQIEEGDEFERQTERRPNGKSTVALPCPECQASLSFVRPNLRGAL